MPLSPVLNWLLAITNDMPQLKASTSSAKKIKEKSQLSIKNKHLSTPQFILAMLPPTPIPIQGVLFPIVQNSTKMRSSPDVEFNMQLDPLERNDEEVRTP